MPSTRSAPVAGPTVPVTLATADGRTLPPVSWQGDGKAGGDGAGHLGRDLAGRGQPHCG